MLAVTRQGVLIRTRAADISTQGRSASGVRVISPDDDDTVASIALVDIDEDEAVDIDEDEAVDIDEDEAVTRDEGDPDREVQGTADATEASEESTD